ncbi:zinc/cadmium/mercury/lead-transporting ATPase [Erwinia pyri]|uniref:P-type Zn(2+) transporter n=1 Tax=Erwinia pyri TaxID=3062598 RepID=A0AA50DLQ2_9GAMM|nr:zinc/cadmium/mercury/lead-transporting ATPase [Erwinia sp. DE2]WLS79213.1 zinc/cadmium/mercury/lead-transporting ATPase [Erwinia sp. DE2]
MHSHSSPCSCGHRHAPGQPDCSAKPRPVIRKIAAITPAAPESSCCSESGCSSGSECEEESDRARFSWLIEGMDCPACARKIETAVSNLPDVAQARVLFATEKLVVNADKDVRQQVEAAVARAGFKLRLSNASHTADPSPGFWQENRALILLCGLMLVSWLIHIVHPQAGEIAFTLTTLVGVWPVARSALRLIRSGTPFAIETLMSVAAIGALFIGATAEAAMVLLLFLLGERLESFAASRARRGVTALMALKPEEAVRLNGNVRETVPLSALRPGDRIEVAAGSRLPADARLLSSFASFDESALTGESVPVERQQGETVAAGCLSVDRQVQLEVVSEPGESAIDRILHLIEEAEANRAPIERFLDRFSRIYTPIIMALALLTAIIPPLLMAAEWQPWIYKGLTLLLIGCPCALVISTPAAITSGLAAASRRGVLIKGGAALESLNGVRTLAFDKTGTLTQGKPQVVAVVPLTEESEVSLLAKAAAVESGSSHPLAKAMVAQAAERKLTLPQASEQRALAGSGVEAVVGGHKLLISAPGRLAANVLTSRQAEQVIRLEAEGNTVVVLLEESRPTALIVLRDTLRPDALAALAELKAMNIQAVMLTGDNPRAAAAIAGELGIDYRAGLLPADKVAAIGELNQQQPVAMVGDGINDAPAMKAATIGIAMGSGSDVALETADAALTHNRLGGLATMIRLSRATHANIRQNVTIALGLKGIFLITTLMGITGLWLAVLADSGATALVTANALRLLRKS